MLIVLAVSMHWDSGIGLSSATFPVDARLRIGIGVCLYAFILVIWCFFGMHTSVFGMIFLIETNRLSIGGCLDFRI